MEMVFIKILTRNVSQGGGEVKATAADQNSLITHLWHFSPWPLIVQGLVELELDKWLI